MEFLWSKTTEYSAGDFGAHDALFVNGNTVYVPFRSVTENFQREIEFSALNAYTGAPMANTPPRKKIVALPTSRVSYEQKEYPFEPFDMTVRSKSVGGHIIEAYRNRRPLWRFKHWAYLYTDMIEKNGCLIFGTDGMGSRLYCVDILTGALVSETKTHYTGFYDFRAFNWHEDSLVVYGKNALTVLDPFTGKTVDEHKIPARYPYRSLLQVINGLAYCRVLTDDNTPTWLCFKL